MSDPATDPIVIRRAESPADYIACQDAQRRSWGLADESYVVPVATLVGANLHGGLVLGRFCRMVRPLASPSRSSVGSRGSSDSIPSSPA